MAKKVMKKTAAKFASKTAKVSAPKSVRALPAPQKRAKVATAPPARQKRAVAPAEAIPAPPKPQPLNRALNDAVLQLARLTDPLASRFTTQAILVEADKAVVTDGHQLTMVDLPKQDFSGVPAIPGMELAETWQPFLLHKDTALEMARAIDRKAAKQLPACGNVYVGASTSKDKRIVQVGATDLKRPKVVTGEAPTGNFPDYERLIPKEPDYQICVNAELLGRVLDYARKFHGAEARTTPVVLSFWRHQESTGREKWQMLPFTVEAENGDGQKMKSVIAPMRMDSVTQSPAMKGGAPQLIEKPATPAAKAPAPAAPPPPEVEAEDDELPKPPRLRRFVLDMRAAKSLDEARTIIHDHEEWLNQMDRANGFTPVVGEVDETYSRGFSTVKPHEQREWIKFYRDSKVEQSRIDHLIDAIQQGNEMHALFNEMLQASYKERVTPHVPRKQEPAAPRKQARYKPQPAPAAKRAAPPAPRAASGTGPIFGHPTSAILRWLGREELTSSEATEVLAAHGVTCSPTMIRDNIGAGRRSSPRYDASRIPQLTPEQASKLLRVVRKQARSSAPNTSAAYRRR